MEFRQLLGVLDRVLDEAGVAILANVAEDGSPAMRWMSPAIIRGHEGSLFAISSPDFTKVASLRKNAKVTWMIQNKALSEIVNLRGTIHVIEDASLQSLAQEAIGAKLGTFWKMNPDSSKVVVLETVIDSIEYLKTAGGEKKSVDRGDR